MNKIFDFHLFKLTAAEYEVARANFVSEGLTLLCNTKWKIRVKGIDNILVIRKNTLGSFRTKITNRFIVSHRSDRC
ncbi:hypothetical protein FQZ97_887550 [compost metagenome]